MGGSSLKLAFGLAMLLAGEAGAATLCSAPGPHPDGLDVSDVTFNGTVSSDCYAVVFGTNAAGNIGFSGFSLVAADTLESGSGTGSAGGIDLTLTVTSTPAGEFGSWTLGWSGALPVTLDIVAVFQTSTAFASYFFDDLVLGTAPVEGVGAWQIAFTINGEVPPLTQMVVYASDVRGPTDPGGTGGGGSIPEPGTALLFAAVMLPIAGLARRRFRSASVGASPRGFQPVRRLNASAYRGTRAARR